MDFNANNLKLHDLLIDPNFLELAKFRNRPNIFDTVAASHIELWHSAFIKWLLDPNSYLGLKDFPLKRFLFVILQFGRVTTPEQEKPGLMLGELENMILDSVEFETEFTDDKLRNPKGNKAKLDIIGLSEKVWIKSTEDTRSLRIIIENKISAKETNEQTKIYQQYAELSRENFDYDFLIFLTPDESQSPASDKFIQITYQEICDYVIKPSLRHPELSDESQYLLEQYLINLGKPIKGGLVMALPNKEICQEIYNAHKSILDEIFLVVKGKVPKSDSPKQKIRRANVTLEQLIEKNILDLSDTILANYKNEEYSATLKAQEDKDDYPSIIVVYNGTEYSSISSAATAITSTNMNGWTFWRVKDKGKLCNLREQLLNNQNIDDED
ncbi:MAG: PD-(D/E)XK nuclease family protein [Chlamydiia bacterium]|nr:PD-(D/E)XK nuclease family protein [Chlamydiia bacterium]